MKKYISFIVYFLFFHLMIQATTVHAGGEDKVVWVMTPSPKAIICKYIEAADLCIKAMLNSAISLIQFLK